MAKVGEWKFVLEDGDFWNGNALLCQDELSQLVELPANVKKIWVSVYDTPQPEGICFAIHDRVIWSRARVLPGPTDRRVLPGPTDRFAARVLPGPGTYWAVIRY